MRAMLLSKEVRTGEVSYLSFEVDENLYRDDNGRVVTKATSLDGTVITTDWGYLETLKEISVTTYLSVTDYESLRSFQEDNDNSFLYCYKNDTWRVIIKTVTKVPVGSKYKVTIALSVTEKLLGDGEYSFTSSSSSSSSLSSSSSSSASS